MSSRVEKTRIAKRYARAAFSWAKDHKKLLDLENDLVILEQILVDVVELRPILETPMMSRAEHQIAMDALCKKAKVSDVMQRLIGVVVTNRRLNCLSAIISALRVLMSAHKGEVTVDVISATKLSPAQTKEIADVLKKQLGQSVELRVTQDADLIGGLIVKAGSLMVDSSVKTQLEKMTRTLKNSDVLQEQEKMKEVA